MSSTNFIYFATPCRLNQTSFQSDRKRKGESKREKREILFPSLPLSLPSPFSSLFFSPFSLSLLPSAPSRSAFCLSSLREWSTIKDLIKTPEQAKAPWQTAKSGPARTGRQRLPFGPRAGLWTGGGRGVRQGWGAWPGLGSRPLLLAQLG